MSEGSNQRWILLVIVLLLSACTSQDVIDIYGRDNDALYSVQTTFPVSIKETPFYLKLQSLKTSANFLQSVPSGKFIDFENIQLWGPESISVESGISTASVSIGSLDLEISDVFSSSFFIGLSQSEFDADIVFQSGPAVSIRDRVLEAYVDIGLWYQLTDKLKLGLMLALTRNINIGGYSDAQLFLNYQLFPHMEVMVGVHDFFYDYNRSGSASTLFIESRGPFITLNFPF